MDFHGIPWSSMEFVVIFSMEFHGVLGHGFPWNSMEYFPTSFPGSSMEFHGVPWNSMEKEYQEEFH